MTNPAPPPHPASPVEFGRATPILRVADMETSLAWYRDQLGFTIKWQTPVFTGLARGEMSLMLALDDQGHAGTWVYVGVDDADALHLELRARGVAIRQPPVNFPWGAREMQVCDPDGHVLRFGSDAGPGEPMGDWLDGAGGRWVLQPDGSWCKAS